MRGRVHLSVDAALMFAFPKLHVRNGKRQALTMVVSTVIQIECAPRSAASLISSADFFLRC